MASAASQAFGVAAGIQDKFSWKGVALAGISAGVSGGLAGGFGAVAGSPFLGDAVRGALGSAIGQGIGVATGLQSKFDFAGVAAAGLGMGASGAVGLGGFGGQVVRNTAGGLANAAARGLLEGTSFGDNILAALPDIIGQTIGGMVADRMAQGGSRRRMALGAYAAAGYGADSDTQDVPDPNVRSDVPTNLRFAPNDDGKKHNATVTYDGEAITVTAKRQRGFLDWVDSWADTNLGGHNPHDRSKQKAERIVVTFFQPSVRSGAGYDRMGQPLRGRSSYDAGRQFSNIISDANKVSLGTTFGRLGEWATYRVPDAAQRNAEMFDPYRGMTPGGRALAARLDRLEGGTISGIATGVSIQSGADQATQDLGYGLGSAGDGFLLAVGGMAGVRVPGIGNQRELNIVNGQNGVHGNSKLSGRTTYLYELYQKDGTFLKYGISVNPDARYSRSFMSDKRIFRVTSGTRADMMALERQMVISNPTGQMNREYWAVKARQGN